MGDSGGVTFGGVNGVTTRGADGTTVGAVGGGTIGLGTTVGVVGGVTTGGADGATIDGVGGVTIGDFRLRSGTYSPPKKLKEDKSQVPSLMIPESSRADYILSEAESSFKMIAQASKGAISTTLEMLILIGSDKNSFLK